MSLFGKILAVLNLLALCAFFYLAIVDFQARQAWSYAVFRWDLALDGFPVDEEEPDGRFRLRFLNVTAKDDPLRAELTGNDSVRTMEDYLELRKGQILKRAEGATDKESIDKLLDVLIAMGQTAGEREQFQAMKGDESPDLKKKLQAQLEDRFEALKKLPLKAPDEKKDRDGKKYAIARTLFNLVDVLPTAEEMKQRAAADPTTDKTYRQTLNVIGLRLAASVLDSEAREFLAMGVAVGDQRQKERILFSYHHQQLINQLIDREHQLQEQRDLLKVKIDQAKKQEALAIEQEALVRDRSRDLDELRKLTANGKEDAKGKLQQPGLKQLEIEQQRVFRLRKRLRDANRDNQDMERQIRELETQKAAKGTD